MTEKLLDLSIARLVPERPTVKLRDGNAYEMRLPTEFGMEGQVRSTRLGELLVNLYNGQGDLTPEEVAALKTATTALIRDILPSAPRKSVEALDDFERSQILDFFRSFRQAARETETPPQTDGEPASPNSNGSTAETQAAG